MPKVGNKKFPYTKAGYKAAAKARKKEIESPEMVMKKRMMMREKMREKEMKKMKKKMMK